MRKIVSYQPTWPGEFLVLGKALRQALGDLAIRIDHIGSTSVPGLAAKDIIDIQVSVADLSQELEQVFSHAGYIRLKGIIHDHLPPGKKHMESEWVKWLYGPPPSQRSCNIHVRLLGRSNQRYALLFRDYLRSHPATAEAYAELKMRLAQSLADPSMYPEVKDPAVDLIFLAAEDWAVITNWLPGPTDC